MRRHGGFLIVFLAAGCAAVPAAHEKAETPAQATQRRSSAAPPQYNLTGYPPAVRDGYIDGCESAKRTRYANKDAKRFASDAQYAMGWNDGYSICRK